MNFEACDSNYHRNRLEVAATLGPTAQITG